MKIALIGATGFIGSHLLQEALDRQHEVTALVRRPERITARPGVVASAVDVHDADSLVKLLVGHEAVISAFSADKGEGFYDGMVSGARAIIAATKTAAVGRLLVVGGAGSLLNAEGQQLLEEPGFPENWLGGALGTREFLYMLREEPGLDWTFLCPARVIQPGERTGRFRLGGDSLLTDDQGQSLISLQDYAVAMIDELENPAHSRQRFSVAY